MKTFLFLFSILILKSCGSNNTIPQTNEVQNDINISGKVICEDIGNPLEIYLVNLTNGEVNLHQSKFLLSIETDTFNIKIDQELLLNYSHLYLTKGMYDNQFLLRELKEGYKEFKLYKTKEYIVKKPAIYLYPTEKTDITILHDFKGTITNTYPEYVKGWHVTAFPDGKLIDKTDNRIHNYLFWDGVYNFPKEHATFDSGFVVKKQNTIDFLQKTLANIGLNNTEINDFIVFWLPELTENEINFIHFSINNNIDNSSFLNIQPTPDTQIRVFMEFYGISDESNIKLPVQKLPIFERKGFTMVEWGGAIIPNNKFQLL